MDCSGDMIFIVCFGIFGLIMTIIVSVMGYKWYRMGMDYINWANALENEIRDIGPPPPPEREKLNQ